jgi:hypothetical protein
MYICVYFKNFNVKTSIIVAILFFLSFHISGQIINFPNVGVKSHPTLTIEKIEYKPDAINILLSVKNESEQGGWFCADKNIYMQDLLTHKKYKLIKSENIPVCPESHQFKKAGEVLKFTLYFPPLEQDVKYIDLIEDCNNACFFFKGVILDKSFNEKIEFAYQLYAHNKSEQSVEAFSKIITEYPDFPYGIFYFNLIKIYSELNQWEKVKEWYLKLSDSNVLDKIYYQDLIKKMKYYN